MTARPYAQVELLAFNGRIIFHRLRGGHTAVTRKGWYFHLRKHLFANDHLAHKYEAALAAAGIYSGTICQSPRKLLRAMKVIAESEGLPFESRLHIITEWITDDERYRLCKYASDDEAYWLVRYHTAETSWFFLDSPTDQHQLLTQFPSKAAALRTIEQIEAGQS